MKKNAMEREREAVDSEFEQALPSDYNRRQQGQDSIEKKNPAENTAINPADIRKRVLSSTG